MGTEELKRLRLLWGLSDRFQLLGWEEKPFAGVRYAGSILKLL